MVRPAVSAARHVAASEATTAIELRDVNKWFGSFQALRTPHEFFSKPRSERARQFLAQILK